MRILVNAVSIKEGGPRVVLTRLLAAMRTQRPDAEWCVAAPPDLAAEYDAQARATSIAVSAETSPARLLKWYEFDLPAAARRWRADVVFSMTNYLPRRRLPVPSLLLEQHAGHFSPAFDRLTHEAAPSALARLLWRRKRRWVYRSVEAATVLTVQTAALADAVAAATRVSRSSIRVIQHGSGWVRHAEAPRVLQSGKPWRIGYVAKWGVQKNFDTLFSAVRMLAAAGRPVTLVLTLDPFHASVARVLQTARDMGIGALVENRGEVAGTAVEAIYDTLDAFVFPSLCESFGMPMVEAMARGLPIVVADTPENREITAEAGIAFPAFDAERLAAILDGLLSDPALHAARATSSLARARQFTWAKAGRETFAALDAAAGGGVA